VAALVSTIPGLPICPPRKSVFDGFGPFRDFTMVSVRGFLACRVSCSSMPSFLAGGASKSGDVSMMRNPSLEALMMSLAEAGEAGSVWLAEISRRGRLGRGIQASRTACMISPPTFFSN